jgi:hypothetical protein
VLGSVAGPSSLTASMSTTVELLERRIDVATANKVCYGTHSALVVIMSHFLELKASLEVLVSGHNAA